MGLARNLVEQIVVDRADRLDELIEFSRLADDADEMADLADHAPRLGVSGSVLTHPMRLWPSPIRVARRRQGWWLGLRICSTVIHDLLISCRRQFARDRMRDELAPRLVGLEHLRDSAKRPCLEAADNLVPEPR